MRLNKILYLFLNLNILGCADPLSEVFTNYKENKVEIEKAVNYFSEIKPKNLKLYIRFETEGKIDIEINQRDYWDKNTWDTSKIFDQYGQFQKYDINTDDPSFLKALRILKLDKEKVEKLKLNLFKAGCNSISNGFSFSDDVKVGYTRIGYPTHDLYGLDYIVLEREIEDSIVNKITKACNIKAINKYVLVNYAGPAFGSNCFPDKR
ncbi:MAG: hypothetical protein WCK82_00175 [Bacteroidota bacterium]|jgi:hypothetical protein